MTLAMTTAMAVLDVAEDGTLVPGRPGPGRPGHGAPVPGRPVPGRPVPGRPVPGRSVPGRSVPGRPVPGGPVPSRAAAPPRRQAVVVPFPASGRPVVPAPRVSPEAWAWPESKASRGVPAGSLRPVQAGSARSARPVEVRSPRAAVPGPVRLTRRGRIVVGALAIAAAAAVTCVLSLALASGALAANHGPARAGYQGMRQIVVQPGQTLWSIAAAAAPAADPRVIIPQLEAANSLNGSTVYPGEALWVPAR
jgi:LysM domain